MRLAYFLPAVLFAGLLVAFAAGLGRDPSQLPSTLIGKPVPTFDLPPVRDEPAGLRSVELRGEPRLLNVFASWCVACKAEHPMLLRLKDDGVAIDGLDWKDTAAAGAQYLAASGDPFRRVGSDPSGRAGIDLGVAGVPETFVIDGRGQIAYKHIGPITEEDWERKIQPLMLRLRREG